MTDCPKSSDLKQLSLIWQFLMIRNLKAVYLLGQVQGLLQDCSPAVSRSCSRLKVRLGEAVHLSVPTQLLGVLSSSAGGLSAGTSPQGSWLVLELAI